MRNKKSANEWIKEYIDIQKKNEAIKQEMFENYDYINWIEKYTSQHPSFTDNVDEDSASKEDILQIKKLPIFFDAVSSYANANYIMPTNMNKTFSNSHVISHNNLYYEVGFLCGQSAEFYCTKVKPTKAIKFVDILLNKKQPNVPSIENKLGKINKLVEDLNMLGLPTSVIIKSIEAKAYKNNEEDIKY